MTLLVTVRLFIDLHIKTGNKTTFSSLTQHVNRYCIMIIVLLQVCVQDRVIMTNCCVWMLTFMWCCLLYSIIKLTLQFTMSPDHIKTWPNNPRSYPPPLRCWCLKCFSLVVKSVLNSSSSCPSSLCLCCLLLCWFCLLCVLSIMMKGQGYTEWGYSDCTVTEAINCWCRGREEEVGQEENRNIL